MNDIVIISLLLCYILVRECFYIYSSNKLLDKLMSRNYNEYQWTKNMAKVAEQKPQPFKEETELPEDLNALTGFGMN